MEADGEAANPFESALRAAVLKAGVTGFRPQQRVALATRVVHVDLGDPERRIALEADSFAHHGSRAALRDDCHRYDELVRAGWTVLRFAWKTSSSSPNGSVPSSGTPASVRTGRRDRRPNRK